MTPVDPRDGSPEDSRPFEQWLLDSAGEDELPRDVAGAWARFGASLGSASGLAATGGGAVPPSSSGALARVARSGAVKWLFLGAFAGSVLTLVWVNRTRHLRAREISQVSHVTIAMSGSLAAPMVSAAAAFGSSVAEVERGAASEAERPLPRIAHRDVPLAVSSLGAQVALLDAARAALVAGSFAAALQATDRYERQFPHGELRPDSEVVAIEALSASGEESACRERAARFLTRYPADPHAARVKALAERAARAPQAPAE